MSTAEYLAGLAYQNGDKALQRGWLDYVRDAAKKQDIPLPDLITEIEQLKTKNGRTENPNSR